MNSYLYWIGQYRRYVESMDGFVAHLDASIPLTQDQRAALRSSPLDELNFGVGLEELEEATDIFPNLLRRSAFLLLFTLLERTLTHIAEEAQRRSSNPISLDDLRGTGFARVVRYLALVANVDIRGFVQWNHLHRLQLLRNAFVHRNGVIGVDGDEVDLVSFVKASPYLVAAPLPRGYIVQVKAGFCEEAVGIVEGTLIAIPPAAWGRVA